LPEPSLAFSSLLLVILQLLRVNIVISAEHSKIEA
jgi:hypothetical protein